MWNGTRTTDTIQAFDATVGLVPLRPHQRRSIVKNGEWGMPRGKRGYACAVDIQLLIRR